MMAVGGLTEKGLEEDGCCLFGLVVEVAIQLYFII